MDGDNVHTLKLCDAEPVLPGLALPEAFESLDRRLESSIKLCKLSTPPEGHVLNMISICQELQRLLKCSFVENGILASRMEMLVKHQENSMKKMNTKISAFDLEQKVTKKHIKRLRKRLSVHDIYHRKKNESWWNINVRSSDYETFSVLSRTSGSPDLEFVLRINQILIDFVTDLDKTELQLPPMGQDERAELSKLASVYKIRCRYGKSTQVASSALIKARQTCIPGHGEVDAILDGFAKAQNLKRLFASSSTEEIKNETVEFEESSGKANTQSPVSAIPPTMLTPLSTLASSSIDMSASTSVNLTPARSPTSGLSTPTNELVKVRGASHDKTTKSRSRCGSQSNENPLLGSGSRSTIGGNGVKSSSSAHSSPAPVGVVGGVSLGVGGMMPTVGSLASLQTPPHVKLSGALALSLQKPPPHLPSSSRRQSTQSSKVLERGVVLQQHQQQLQQQLIGTCPGIRSLNQPTVVASPLKIPVSQLPHAVQHNLSTWGGVRGSGGFGEAGKTGIKRDSGGERGERTATVQGGKEVEGRPITLAVAAAEALSPKRIRLVRKVVVGSDSAEN